MNLNDYFNYLIRESGFKPLSLRHIQIKRLAIYSGPFYWAKDRTLNPRVPLYYKQAIPPQDSRLKSYQK
jgi:hypothetical protein